jgi:hypothetical protein
MGQNNSTLKEIQNISPDNLSCDTACQNKKKTEKLFNEKTRLTAFRDTTNQQLKEINSTIDEITNDPKKLESLKFNSNIKIIDSETNRFRLLFDQLMNELETRINLFLKQYKFYTKNNIVLDDLEEKVNNGEKLVRKKQGEYDKNKRIIDNIKLDTEYLEQKMNGRIFILKVLISIIVSIFVIFLVGLYYNREKVTQFYQTLNIKQLFIDLKDSIKSIGKSSS